MSIRVVLVQPVPNTYLHGVCKHRSGQFSSCAGVCFFQLGGHYQTAQWAKEWQGNLTFNTVHYSCLCLDIAKSLSTVLTL